MTLTLVTTAEESSWPDKGMVLFLGEWCKKHNKINKWSKLSSITARPYIVDPIEKEKINYFGENLFNTILHELTEELNKVHGTNYSQRYWNIIIGHWLRKYVKVIINRYGTLEQALSNYPVTHSIISSSSTTRLSTSTYSDFSISIFDELWNYELYSNILKHWPGLNINFKKNSICSKNNLGVKKRYIRPSNWKSYAKQLTISFFKLLSFFSKKTDAVIIKSYLTPWQELKLQILLGQIPQLWSTPEAPKVKYDTSIRESFFQNYSEYTGIQKEVRRLLSDLIPTCYLEGYKFMTMESEKLPWPSKPKFIFTSNSFSTDEIFKFWVAKKSEHGFKYYVGQHGNNYGTLKGTEFCPEVTTCDQFYSWGWKDVYLSQKTIPAFLFLYSNRVVKKYNKEGGLLIFKVSSGGGGGCHDKYYEHSVYMLYVFSFFDRISKSIQGRSIVRLHHGSTEKGLSDKSDWKLKYPGVSVDDGFIDKYKLIKDSRLVVHTYDSTGLLETLSMNIPTICFWHEGFNSLFSDAVPYYELLVDVGIVHKHPESAAQHINTNWNDIDAWWCSKKTQEARIKFCKRYAVRVKNPGLSLKKILKDNL